MPTEIESENTLRALRGETLAKVCTECEHYKLEYTHAKCMRDVHVIFDVVSGKQKALGEEHYCEHQRDKCATWDRRVKEGTWCGHIGQFWTPALPKPPAALRWWQQIRWGR